MKNMTDAERFARYHAVLSLLLKKDSFYKFDIYEVLKDEEKAFIGRVISELVSRVKNIHSKYGVLND